MGAVGTVDHGDVDAEYDAFDPEPPDGSPVTRLPLGFDHVGAGSRPKRPSGLAAAVAQLGRGTVLSTAPVRRASWRHVGQAAPTGDGASTYVLSMP